MNKSHSYFVLLEELKQPGCPICSLFIKDSQSYLDALLYENVLDVPTRLNLMESFGFCNRHAWQIPKLPAICSPAAGFAVFASDLLRKFNLVVGAMNRRISEEEHLEIFVAQGYPTGLSTDESRSLPGVQPCSRIRSLPPRGPCERNHRSRVPRSLRSLKGNLFAPSVRRRAKAFRPS